MNSKEVKYIRVTAISDEEIQADMYLVGDEDSKPLRIRKEGNEFTSQLYQTIVASNLAEVGKTFVLESPLITTNYVLAEVKE